MAIENSLQPQEPVLEDKTVQPESGARPFFRKIFFALVIVLFIVLFLFLVYQNGKSIYDNGL